MFNLGLPELIVIFVVVFLLFGAKALPEIAKGIGEAMRLFKREVNDVTKVDDDKSNASQILAASEKKKLDDSNDFDSNQQRRDWRPNSSDKV